MANPIESFIWEYFVRPIVDHSVPGYNAVNTMVYGLILIGVAFYVIFPALHKRGIVFDLSFVKTIFPYIIFGSSLRVLEDQHILMRSGNPLEAGFYILTPGIWILTFALLILGMLVGKALAPSLKKKWETITMVFGLVFALPLVAFNLINGKEWAGSIGIIALTLVICWIIFAIAKNRKWSFLDSSLAKLAFAGQMLDASATFIALQFFGCGEQHVIPRLLFGAFGPVSFFFVKIPLMLLVLHFLTQEFKQADHKDAALLNFILVFLIILGFATGLRDLFTVLVGTCSPAA